MPNPNPQARRWMWVYNNPPMPGQEYFEFLETKNDVIKWCVFQLERAPTTGTPHFQGFVGFNNPKRLTEVKKLFNCNSLHLETMVAKQATYAMKEDTRIEGPWKFGKLPSPGERTDILKMHDAIKRGDPLNDIIDNHAAPFYKYSKAALWVRNRFTSDRTEKPKVVLYSGPPGCGKTLRAVTFAKNRNLTFYTRTLTNHWFDGYEQQDVCILDEVDKKAMPFSQLLNVLDRGACSVEVKGGTTKFNSKYVFMTSTVPPKDWYPNWPKSNEQLQRRIDLWYDWNSETRQFELQELFRGQDLRPEDIVESPELANL